MGKKKKSGSHAADADGLKVHNGLSANGKSTADCPQPACNEDAIRLHAYQQWEAAGKPEGDGLQFWLQAEQHFRQNGIQ